MKKMLLLLVALTALYSCSKQGDEPRSEQPSQNEAPISLDFVAEVGDTELKGLEAQVNGTSTNGTFNGNLVTFRGQNTVMAWIYVVDKNGLVAKVRRSLQVKDAGRTLVYKGEVAPESKSVDKATAKLSIYIGLDANGLFANKGFKAIPEFGKATNSPIGGSSEEFCILKSENNPLTFIPEKRHWYKTNGKLTFTMSGSLFFIRFRNDFLANSEGLVPNSGGNPGFRGGNGNSRPRNAAQVNQLSVANFPVKESLEVVVKNGRTELAKKAGTLSSIFVQNTVYDRAFTQTLPQSYSFPAGQSAATMSKRPGQDETVFAFYSPLPVTPDTPGDPLAFGYKLANAAHYAERRFNPALRQTIAGKQSYYAESLNGASHRATVFDGSTQNGKIYFVLLVNTPVLTDGTGRN